jgi:hypothetical protein
VRGFAILPGAAYVYGGMSHFWMRTGYVSLLGSGPPKEVARFDNDLEFKTERPADPSRPSGPIDHLVPAPDGEGFWAVSSHEVFRVDKALTSWSRTQSLGGRWFGGARYAVANTPTVNSLIVDPERQGLIAAMGRDGLLRVSASGESRTAFAGQLEVDAIDIWTTSAGTLLLPDIRRSPSAWTLGDEGWDGTLFENVAPPTPDGWLECAIAGDDGKGVIVFCATPWFPGDRAMFRVGSDRRAELLERWSNDSSTAMYGWVLSATNQIIDTEDETLRVRDQGKWRTVGRNAMPSQFSRLGRGPQRRFSFLDRIGDVSYFYDSGRGFLAALSPQPGGSWELVPARGLADRAVGLWDAVPDGDHWFLSASHTGLYRVHLPDGQAQRLASPNDRDVITTMARDRQGRLWAGGDAIYVSTDNGARWVVVDLPMASRDSTRRIRPNPNADSGVWISLGDRGFVVVK